MEIDCCTVDVAANAAAAAVVVAVSFASAVAEVLLRLLKFNIPQLCG